MGCFGREFPFPIPIAKSSICSVSCSLSGTSSMQFRFQTYWLLLAVERSTQLVVSTDLEFPEGWSNLLCL